MKPRRFTAEFLIWQQKIYFRNPLIHIPIFAPISCFFTFSNNMFWSTISKALAKPRKIICNLFLPWENHTAPPQDIAVDVYRILLSRCISEPAISYYTWSYNYVNTFLSYPIWLGNSPIYPETACLVTTSKRSSIYQQYISKQCY